jgi:hypothetical protein
LRPRNFGKRGAVVKSVVSRKRTAIAITSLAVALFTFGIIWVVVIYPGLEKVPAGLDKAVQYQGTVTVLDPEIGQPVTYDAITTRKCQAVGCSGDTLYLDETISFVDSVTGEVIPSLDEKSLLAIDRVTRANVPGHGDENRQGLWQFPLGVQAGQDYLVYITGSPTPLDARYVGRENFMGLDVLVYDVASPEEGITIPAEMFDPEMRLYRWIQLKVEPVSGITVYMEDETRRTARIPVYDDLFPNTGDITFADMTVYESDLVFTDMTVKQEVHDASFYRWAIPWGSRYLPGLLFGMAMAAGLFGFIVTRRRRTTEITMVKPVKDGLLPGTYEPEYRY